jgi:hypothetical protein
MHMDIKRLLPEIWTSKIIRTGVIAHLDNDRGVVKLYGKGRWGRTAPDLAWVFATNCFCSSWATCPCDQSFPERRPLVTFRGADQKFIRRISVAVRYTKKVKILLAKYREFPFSRFEVKKFHKKKIFLKTFLDINYKCIIKKIKIEMNLYFYL